MTLMGEIDAAAIALRDFLPVHNRTVQSNNNHYNPFGTHPNVQMNKNSFVHHLWLVLNILWLDHYYVHKYFWIIIVILFHPNMAMEYRYWLH